MNKKRNKFISVLLSAVIILSSFACFSGFAVDNQGDSKPDSRTYIFDVEDATLVQRYCAFMEFFSDNQLELYDVNFDGFVSIGDASLIQMHVAQIIDINSDEYQNQRPTSVPVTEELTTETVTTQEASTAKPATEELTEESKEPETTEPSTTEPVATEPATTEPVATEHSEPVVYFEESVVYMGINERYTLKFETGNDEYTIKSSDNTIAEVNGNGEIIPHKTGVVTITCTLVCGLSAECSVYVGDEADELIMNASELIVGLGESFDLNSFTVGIGKFAANRRFYSLDEDVVVVDSKTGVFTAVGLGGVKVICELNNGVKAECCIKVWEYSPTVRLNTYSVTAGVGEPLGFVSYAEDGKAVVNREYYSENDSIAEINKTTGVLNGKSAGTTRIYCQLQNGFRVYADVKILPAPKTVTLNAYTVNIKVGDVIRLKEFYNDGSYNSPYTLEWTSSDKAISIESRSGYLVTLRAKALGTSVITAKTYNGKTAKCTVTVSGSNVKCIDISSWQGSNVDFNKLKSSGINYVILRSGFSTTSDNQFVNYYNKAKAAGMKIGSYWYMCAQSVNEAKKEAEACIKVLGGRELDLPVYYDVEEPDVLYSHSQTELTNMSVTFCEALKAKGYKVGTYASGSVYARNYKLNTDLFRQKGYSIWDAEWASSNSVACDIWQYSENGYVSGISGNVDMDLIFNLYIED